MDAAADAIPSLEDGYAHPPVCQRARRRGSGDTRSHDDDILRLDLVDQERGGTST
jgi:hypothetical protein